MTPRPLQARRLRICRKGFTLGQCSQNEVFMWVDICSVITSNELIGNDLIVNELMEIF